MGGKWEKKSVKQRAGFLKKKNNNFDNALAGMIRKKKDDTNFKISNEAKDVSIDPIDI